MAACMVVQTATPQAATLRSATVITSETVRLSDLFADLEPGQDRPLGPGPAPGASIQVGGGQLLAIADEYGVDWLDQSPSAMATITRAGRMLDQTFFAELVRQNLPEIGNGPVAIELQDFHPFVVATDDPKPVVLSDVKWDQHSGWFTATAYRGRPVGDITQDSFMLTGVIHATHRVIVYARSLPSGTVLSASDVRMNDAYAEHLASKTFTNAAEVEGLTLTHGVVAGEAVSDQDVQRTILLHRGDPVLIAFTAPGLHLTATGRALEDGGASQYARVLNLMSHMIITGRVVSASEVEVEPGSGGVPSDSAGMRSLAAAALAPPRADLSLR